MPTATTTTVTVRPECRKCGTIGKSGKNSCCGRGGSWFRNCGSAGNVKLRHTWYEGIQVCKTRTQSQKASGRQSNAAQQQNSFNVANTGNFKAVATAKAFAFASFNTSIPIPDRIVSIRQADTSMDKSTAASDDTPRDNDTDKTKFKTIPTTITFMPTNTSITSSSSITSILIIDSSYINTLITATTTTIIDGNIVTTIMIDQGVKEAAIKSEWISQGKYYERNNLN